MDHLVHRDFRDRIISYGIILTITVQFGKFPAVDRVVQRSLFRFLVPFSNPFFERLKKSDPYPFPLLPA